MTRTQQLARRQDTDPRAQQSESQPQGQLRETEQALTPPADIFEDADGISILIDMPGVAKDRLNVKADRNGILVEGDASIEMPEGMEATYAEIRSARFRRSFTVTSELDTDAIKASIKDGVLTLRIPKRAEVKPRQIEIEAS